MVNEQNSEALLVLNSGNGKIDKNQRQMQLAFLKIILKIYNLYEKIKKSIKTIGKYKKIWGNKKRSRPVNPPASKRGKYEKNLSKNNFLFFDVSIILCICEQTVRKK